MPISSTGTRTPAKNITTDDGQFTGVLRAEDFAICDNNDPRTQVKFSIPTTITPDTAVTLGLPAATGALSAVRRYFGNMTGAASIPLTVDVEYPIAEFVTVENTSGLTVGLAPFALTTPADGWLDLTVSLEAKAASATARFFLILNLAGVWTHTIVSNVVDTNYNVTSGNIKIPVTAGQVWGITAYMEGQSGNISRNADGCKISAFFYS